ncbi:aromatic acid exporter family protein [Streptomyces sp. NPDC048272]|uniref:FUSC family protein n=1 Tax=Streptomyces sp. NPDC048272 TaxID=3154616 RepID=UPI003418E36F
MAAAPARSRAPTFVNGGRGIRPKEVIDLPKRAEIGKRVQVVVGEQAGFLRRAVGGSGRERDALLLGAKTVVAAMVAWVLARYLLPPTVSTFAPFTALVALQATVYRSVRDSAQYLVAMAAGAALAATFAAVAGIHGWTFGLLTLVALGVGRIRRFGQQGTQVAIVGFFAFSSGQGKIDYIGYLGASVMLGALCGLAAHLVLAPARHIHHRQQSVSDLYTAMSGRLDGLADVFQCEDFDPERVRQWRRDWQRLSADCERIRQSIDTEIENSRLHPRGGLGSADAALPRARDAVTVAERAMDHLRSMTRALDYALDSGEITNLSASFRTRFSSLLRNGAAAMEEIGQTSSTDSSRLAVLLDDAEVELDRIQRQEWVPAEAPPEVHTLRGTLLTDAGRLLADLRSGHQALTPTS